ncbi:MAG TPA: hypothetical protein PLP01_05805 [Phycisphaerae bacterium]|nr:hypothetical protein [Phycisphaerae bacterium]
MNAVICCALMAVLCALTLFFLLGKAFFLAPYRIGWFMMMANLVYELLFKKFRWSRWRIDAVLLAVVAVGWAWLTPWYAAGAVTLLCALAWASTLRTDTRWRTGEMARQDHRQIGRVPLPIPRMIVQIRGPILSRGKVHDLGHWPQGHEAAFEVVVLNPSMVVPQLPMSIEVRAEGGLEAIVEEPFDGRAPDPEQVARLPFRLRAAPGGGAGTATVRVVHGDLVIQQTLRLGGTTAAGATVAKAEIRRWKGGARAAFGWRGDHDLYDPATFQSVKGLQVALGLSRRFRIPSSMYLSGRLSLIQDEHRAFCEHFGWDRRTEEIPDFIRFMKEDVHLASEMDWPFFCERPYFVELGNHMYLHLHTHAAADPGNQWGHRAWIGSGTYPWQGEAKDSFSEQRDNCRKNTEVIEQILGFHVRSWGIPGRCFDENTSAALEAAGIEVASDSDASAWRNVVSLVPPHHPKGCTHMAEINKKQPGDPSNSYKIAMLKYWAHANRRAGSTMLFMAHHHLLQHEGSSCYHLTEEYFRYVLSECYGDFYVTTVTGMGMYWKRVLSPKTRCVNVESDARSVRVTNSGTVALDALPLEIEMSDGARYMTLVDVPANGQTTVAVG